MITPGSWILCALLLLMMGVAFVPRVAARANASRPLMRAGKACSGFLSRWYWPLFILALVIGIGVRIYRFPELPKGLNQDGVMAGVEALSLLRDGTDQYGTSWPVYFEGWHYAQMNVLYSYLLIPFVALMGLTRLSLRLPMLLVSLLALPVMWDFARRMAGRSFALLILFFMAVCPWHIVQSRWALEANLMGHMMLFSAYFLYLGLRHRPFLYLSMVFFGLTMYTYGVTAYTIPVLLLLLAVYLLRRRLVRVRDLLICLGIYLLVSAPFFLMLFLNAFGGETFRWGPFTVQYFSQTIRSEDILFFSPEPLRQLGENLLALMEVTLLQTEGAEYQAYPVTRTLYAFSVPAIVGGIGLLFVRRRRMAKAGLDTQDGLDPWGATLTLCWLLSMFLCGLLTNGVNVNRVNGIYYPLILCTGYLLYEMCRRVKVLTLGVAVIYLIGFGTFCQGYFTDEAYIERVGILSSSGATEALDFAHELDCDRYYVSSTRLGEFMGPLYAMFSHEIDARQRDDQREVTDAFGTEMGYYSDRYIFVPFKDFIPDPLSCSVYIILQDEKQWFDPEDFFLEDFDLYAVAYPKHWFE